MSQALGPALNNAVAGRTQSIIVLVNAARRSTARRSSCR
jgi:hypothetical protein